MSPEKLAVCVPYRNRERHLNEFVPHMDAFLNRMGIDYKIFVIHQADTAPFNRGMLKNIGFDIACREGFDTFVFHDIDMLPEDESCDYSAPRRTPVHLAARISSNDYKSIYATYFGGVVLFSRRQFETVNGYSNAYWGWGAEDDDLFSRCVLAGLTETTLQKVKPREHHYATFNGVSTRGWLQPKTERLQNVMKRNHTMCLLVRPDVQRSDTGNWPFNTRSYTPLPLITRHSLPLLTHSRISYVGQFYDQDNVVTNVACRRSDPLSFPDGWEMVTLVVNVDEGYQKILLNGTFFDAVTIGTTFVGDWNRLTGPPREYHDTPFVIGYVDVPKPYLNYFQGDISELTIWDQCLEDEVLEDFLGNREEGRWRQGCVCDTEFAGPLRENSDYALHIRNATYESSILNRYQGMSIPTRRNGKYKNIDMREEVHKRTEEEALFRRNMELLARFWWGQIDSSLDGLNTLKYEILETTSVASKAVICHVTFPCPY